MLSIPTGKFHTLCRIVSHTHTAPVTKPIVSSADARPAANMASAMVDVAAVSAGRSHCHRFVFKAASLSAAFEGVERIVHRLITESRGCDQFAKCMFDRSIPVLRPRQVRWLIDAG